MTGWAAIVAELVAAGLSGASLVAACARIEAAQGAKNTGETVVDKFETVETVGETVAKASGGTNRLLAVLAKDERLTASQKVVGRELVKAYWPARHAIHIGADKLVVNTGLSRATVFRALKVLCAENGPFTRFSYGGVRHCNAYRWNMAWFTAAKVASPQQSQQSQNETQNKKDIYNPSDSMRVTARKKAKGFNANPAQREIPLVAAVPTPTGLAKRQHKAIKAGAERRASAADDVFNILRAATKGEEYQDAVLAEYLFDPALQDRAVKAEQRRKGAALVTVLNVLAQRELGQRRTGTDPPELR